MVAIFSGMFGLALGSFLNVVTYRTPLRKSLVAPPSACPHCGHQITARENIPVLSWLFLRGKCSSCAAPISIRYPLVEAGTAAFFVIIALLMSPAIFAASTSTDAAAAVLALVAFLVFASVSVSLALIDIDTKTLPDRIVFPALVAGAVLLGTSSILIGDIESLVRAGIGMVALFGLYFVLAFFSGGMGFGDVKLAAVVGLYLAWLGWGSFAVGALAAFLLGGLFGIALLVLRRAGRRTALPFGPWMLAGAWIGVFWGEALWAGYLRLSGLV
ncbi:A24 family peptidase [soil metagenome]